MFLGAHGRGKKAGGAPGFLAQLGTFARNLASRASSALRSGVAGLKRGVTALGEKATRLLYEPSTLGKAIPTLSKPGSLTQRYRSQPSPANPREPAMFGVPGRRPDDVRRNLETVTLPPQGTVSEDTARRFVAARRAQRAGIFTTEGERDRPPRPKELAAITPTSPAVAAKPATATSPAVVAKPAMPSLEHGRLSPWASRFVGMRRAETAGLSPLALGPHSYQRGPVREWLAHAELASLLNPDPDPGTGVFPPTP